jgi:type I restriction enzyme S subunit
MTHGLKPYPAYKDSGVPWLDKIPAHWDLFRAKLLFRETDERSSTGEEELLSVSHITGVTLRSQKNITMFKAESYVGHKICHANDLVINTMWAWMGALGVARETGLVSPSYAVYRPSDSQEVCSEYLDHLLRTKHYVNEYVRRSTGIRSSRLRMYPEKFLDIPIILPSRHEQESIVAYLRRQNHLMGRYIRAQRKLIALLEEQKQAIIQRAVTRGLDPNIRVKPSGVDWLGEVPEHWEIKRAKYYLREVNERSATGEEELLSVSHITGVTPRSQKNITMFMASSYVGHKLCQPGDLAVNTMWVWMGALGIAKQIGIVSPSYSVYRPLSSHAFVPNFLDSLLRTKPYVSEYVLRSTGIRSSRLRVYPEEFLKIRLVRPPYEEQERIVEAITQKTHHIDRAISQTQREINLIREYRTRLIADVVTGKLDVRQAAANLPDEAEELEELDALEESEEESDEGLDEAEFGGDDDE